MGNIRLGPPEILVQELRDTFDITTFVETGTYRGDTSRWAATVFPNVVTIERSPDLHHEVVDQLNNLHNVEFVLGHTSEELPKIVRSLGSPALFWLDAHWSGAGTAGKDYECPLLDEISAINASSLDHFILVDDARLFLAPPPAPHDPEQWPTLMAVLDQLGRGGRDRYVAVVDDCFVAVPPAAREHIINYARLVTSSELHTNGSGDVRALVRRTVRWGIEASRSLRQL